MGRQTEHRDGSELRAAVHAALGRSELKRLFVAARRRLEENIEAQSFTLREATAGEAAALAQILGAAKEARGDVRVQVAALDRALRESRLCIGLREALELLSGPIVDRRAERAAAQRENAAMWSSATSHDAVVRHPVLADWLKDVRGSGALTRSARAGGLREEALLGRALDVIARLPAGGVSLSVLAAEITGDAHALDPDRRLGALVLRAGVRILGVGDAPASAAARRHLWAELGVLCDPLSAHVLVLGLRVSGGGLVGRHLNECADAGEPRRLTLRELRRESLTAVRGKVVSVCENPTVVAAAADRLGSGSAALVCTEGMPSSAVMNLLGTFATTGARIRMHADFDWGGIRIGNVLASRLPAVEPWRFSRRDYDEALANCRETAPLTGSPVAACWDSRLSDALRAASRAVFEEHVLEGLLGDLG